MKYGVNIQGHIFVGYIVFLGQYIESRIGNTTSIFGSILDTLLADEATNKDSHRLPKIATGDLSCQVNLATISTYAQLYLIELEEAIKLHIRRQK